MTRRALHVVAEVRFATGTVTCTCGWSRTIPEQDGPSFLRDREVKAAYAAHRDHPGEGENP